MRLNKKRVLVTGCASGIGHAQVEYFLAQGYSVYGIDKIACPSLDGDFQFLKLDLTGDLSQLWKWLPSVDILCNTAGVLDGYRPLLDISDDEFDMVMMTNVVAIMRITKQYLTDMVEKGAGIIINMCSIASFLAGGGGIAYTTSKHALAGFTKQLALDYADKGIQVFGIAPGAVKTGMTAADFEPGGLADWVADETPIKRWTNPEEVAELTGFLASGKAISMQGEIVKIDGGWSLK